MVMNFKCHCFIIIYIFMCTFLFLLNYISKLYFISESNTFNSNRSIFILLIWYRYKIKLELRKQIRNIIFSSYASFKIKSFVFILSRILPVKKLNFPRSSFINIIRIFIFFIRFFIFKGYILFSQIYLLIHHRERETVTIIDS